VQLAQDLRTFDFTSPWEGADYVLPGDEKAAPLSPAPAPVATKPDTMGDPHARTPKTTDKPADTGAGKPAELAAKPGVTAGETTGGTVSGQGQGEPVPKTTDVEAPHAPDPTEDRPARKPRGKKAGGEGGAGAAPEGS
jgi:NADH-quinone oxidoreductase subunit C